MPFLRVIDPFVILGNKAILPGLGIIFADIEIRNQFILALPGSCFLT